MPENNKIKIKTNEEIKIMQEGGRKLFHVKNELRKAVKWGQRDGD